MPATKYLKEFDGVELADTHLGVPGPALVRRWRREAPAGFRFTAVAPKELLSDGLKPSAASESAWQSFLPIARELAAERVVLPSPPEATDSKAWRSAFGQLFARLAQSDPSLEFVWDPPPSWSLKDADAAVKDLKVTVARDPLRHPPVSRGSLAYYRLAGPAGHKSRYEDQALEAAAEAIRATRADAVWVIFTNVDMYADARRLAKLLGA